MVGSEKYRRTQMIERLVATKPYSQQAVADITPLSEERQRSRFYDVDSFIPAGRITQEAPKEEAPVSGSKSGYRANAKEKLYNELLAAMLEDDREKIKEISIKLNSEDIKNLPVSDNVIKLFQRTKALSQKVLDTSLVLVEGLTKAGKTDEIKELLPNMKILQENYNAVTKVLLLLEGEKALEEMKASTKELSK